MVPTRIATEYLYWCPTCYARFPKPRALHQHNIDVHVKPVSTRPDGLFNNKPITYCYATDTKRLAKKRSDYYARKEMA